MNDMGDKPLDLDPRWPRNAMAADIPSVLDKNDRNRALLEMVSSGGFADTPALARWSETDEAQPVLRQWLIARAMPLPTDPFAINLAACEREIAEQDKLAAEIETRYG